MFLTSTQYKNWRYSSQRLYEVRHSLNKSAVDVIRNTFESEQPGSSQNVSFLNADEELLLVKLYITKISQLCNLFHFSEELEATAITYLKRFYLKNTVMDWHPKNVMLTALFLATKTTNNPISLEAYTTRIPKTSPSDVLDLEFLVAQSLGFEFAVWHAHRALWGIWLDLQNLPTQPPQIEQSVYDSAMDHIRATRLTDAELIYAPSQIALAALSMAAPALARQWMESKASKAASKLPVDDLQATVNEIQALVIEFGQAPDVESVREVDRRLKLCKNPEKVVGSKAYLAKKAEEEKRLAEKKSKKMMDDDDPFGNELAGDDDDD